uniref:WD repeat-containing protein 43 n=1 Tax=Erigeron canadensis TaxID=72917 RepID=UPI001CB89C47|nr:WD repeat-containing protein 43 [Erigeron canadensis]XP_043629275.1 WD repeat-containing protein 43 [Erigeron canadensis]XP_043629276.1 WD repeat-containing protein 43 [Erigeron canadensis]
MESTRTNISDVLTSFSPSLDFLAISSGDGRIKIWDTIKGQIQTDFANIVSTEETDFFAKPEAGHLSVDYTCMKWLSLEKKKKRKLRSLLLILGTGGGDVLALDVSAGQLKWRVSDCHPGGVTAISSPTVGSCVYTAGVDGMICKLDSMTGNLLDKFKASSKAISSMSVSSDGKHLATAAGQLKIFRCSDNKSIQKFSGHPGAVRCMTFSDNGRYVLSSAIGERYVAIWEVVEDSKKKSSCCVLAMDHPAIFIDSKSYGVEKLGLSVLAISEMGICYLWSGTNIEELHKSKSTKVMVSLEDELSKSHKGALPTIFSAKLQTYSEPSTGHVFLSHGLLIKPTFEKMSIQCGTDIKLTSSMDGILLPMTQSHKSKKGLQNQNQITALDRANTEGALLPVPKIYTVDVENKAMPSTKDDMEVDKVTVCLEDRLRIEGILTSDTDLASNTTQLSKLLKGVDLEANIPQKQMKAAVSSMTSDDAYTLLKVLLTMWQSRSINGQYILPWVCCILVHHSNYVKSEEPASQLLDSLYKFTKSKGDCIQSLLQLSGRLQLLTAQINKAADKSHYLKQEEESEDEDEEDILYDEEDESSENASDDNN